MVNQMAFKNINEAKKFINVLIEYNVANDDDNFYNDIHIYREDEYVIVDWIQKLYGLDFGSFEFVDEGQCVVTEFQYPDGTLGYEFSKGEKEIMLAAWHRDNPGWIQDNCGRWILPGEENDD